MTVTVSPCRAMTTTSTGRFGCATVGGSPSNFSMTTRSTRGGSVTSAMRYPNTVSETSAPDEVLMNETVLLAVGNDGHHTDCPVER